MEEEGEDGEIAKECKNFEGGDGWGDGDGGGEDPHDAGRVGGGFFAVVDGCPGFVLPWCPPGVRGRGQVWTFALRDECAFPEVAVHIIGGWGGPEECAQEEGGEQDEKIPGGAGTFGKGEDEGEGAEAGD